MLRKQDYNKYSVNNNIYLQNKTHNVPKIDLYNSGHNAYVTYHTYYKNEPLSDVACSDGPNGLISKLGYESLNGKLWPYVTSWSDVSWNSKNCGKCLNLKSDTNSVNVIAIDGCGKQKGETHFDVSEIAFKKLFGTLKNGNGYVSYSIVDAKNCGL